MKFAHCPICASQASPDPRAHADLALDKAPNTYIIWRCTGCGLRWMFPHTTPDDYQTIYDHDYYESRQEGGFTYRAEKQELFPCYASIAEHFLSIGIKDRLLDIGCGTGDFLLTAKKFGISGEGIEPSAYAAQKARENGLSVQQGVLSDLPATKIYAAACCSHVLEHVPDANSFMEKLKSILEPDAPLYIEVPIQFDGLLDHINRLRGQRRNYSDFSIHHHYFFTPDALKRLLQAHGFDVVSLATFLPCRRAQRPPRPRKWVLQTLLWVGDRLGQRGDVISAWVRRGK